MSGQGCIYIQALTDLHPPAEESCSEVDELPAWEAICWVQHCTSKYKKLKSASWNLALHQGGLMHPSAGYQCQERFHQPAWRREGRRSCWRWLFCQNYLRPRKGSYRYSWNPENEVGLTWYSLRLTLRISTTRDSQPNDCHLPTVRKWPSSWRLCSRTGSLYHGSPLGQSGSTGEREEGSHRFCVQGRYVPLTKNSWPSRPAGQIKVLHDLRYGLWILANPCPSRATREDSIRHLSRIVQISCDAIWTVQCASCLPAVKSCKDLTLRKTRLCNRLPQWCTHLFYEHLEHLESVISRVEEAGMKLKPSKWQFVRQEVEYLGYVITPKGERLTLSSWMMSSSFQSPRMCVVWDNFWARHPTIDDWLPSLQTYIASTPADGQRRTMSMDIRLSGGFWGSKTRLTEALVLAYPAFGQNFVLETDACGHGLGAVLYQCRDGKLHPVAYGLCAHCRDQKRITVSQSWKHYGRAVTESTLITQW